MLLQMTLFVIHVGHNFYGLFYQETCRNKVDNLVLLFNAIREEPQ